MADSPPPLLLPRKRPANARPPASVRVVDGTGAESFASPGDATESLTTKDEPASPPPDQDYDKEEDKDGECNHTGGEYSHADGEYSHTDSESKHTDGEYSHTDGRAPLGEGRRAVKRHFRAGPQRVSADIRNTCRFDYAPDLCKDYNETGFCGFGDSCKFVHDRGDYKMGWELEREWEERQRRLDRGLEEESYDGGQDSSLAPPQQEEAEPEECGICHQTLQPPIVQTKCGHCFCERCALRVARSSDKCQVCGHRIAGQFKIYKGPPKKSL